jgi:OmpA-OmpF porin, OOP family
MPMARMTSKIQEIRSFGSITFGVFVMKKLSLVMLAAAALLGTTGAMAAQRSQAGATGPYIGGALGWGNSSTDCSGCDESDIAFKLYGGFKFTPQLAVEMAYTNFGDVTRDKQKLSFDAFSAVAAYTFVASRELAITPRAGLAVGHSSGEGGSKTSVAPYLGATLGYTVMPQLTINGVVDMAFIKSKAAGTSTSIFLGGGVSYKF